MLALIRRVNQTRGLQPESPLNRERFYAQIHPAGICASLAYGWSSFFRHPDAAHAFIKPLALRDVDRMGRQGIRA